MMQSEFTPTQPISILLVDDRDEDLLALEVILEDCGARLVKASSGRQALRHVLHEEFAVILLDVSMPEMSGFEVAELIKGRERTRHIPIIFLTAQSRDLDSIYRGYQAGGVDYIVKPLDPNVVQAKVAVFVEMHRRGEEIKWQAEQLRAAERERREAELAELQRSTDRRYKNLAEAIPQIVWTARPSGEASYFNQRWMDHTGLTAAQSLGQGWQAVIHPSDAPRFADEWRRALAQGERLRTECRLRGLTGDYRWHLCEVIPERDRDQRLLGWLGTFTDVNEQREIAEERERVLLSEQRARAEAERAVRLRDEFLSIASHELRTPLAALMLAAQGIGAQMDTQPIDVQRLELKANVLERQAERLSRLIDEMLDASRLEAGTLELHREDFDLGALVREATERFALELERAGCEIEVLLAEGLVGEWDRLRIDQVVVNLLQNAIKYGRGAPIRVSLQRDGGAAELTIEDHGIGISLDDQERIFQRFERAVSARDYSGMGIGLFIVAEILKAHGGAVEVNSAPGRGATFTVRLPLGAQPVSGAERAERASGVITMPAPGFGRSVTPGRA